MDIANFRRPARRGRRGLAGPDFAAVIAAATPSNWWKIDEPSRPFSDSVGAAPDLDILTVGSSSILGGLASASGRSVEILGTATQGQIASGAWDDDAAPYSWEVVLQVLERTVLDNSLLESGNSWAIQTDGSGNWKMDVRSGGVWRGTSAASGPTLGQTYHLGVVVAGGVTRLYVDGVEVASRPEVPDAAASQTWLNLHNEARLRVDHLIRFTREVDAAEMAEHADAALDGTPGSDVPVVASDVMAGSGALGALDTGEPWNAPAAFARDGSGVTATSTNVRARFEHGASDYDMLVDMAVLDEGGINSGLLIADDGSNYLHIQGTFNDVIRITENNSTVRDEAALVWANQSYEILVERRGLAYTVYVDDVQFLQYTAPSSWTAARAAGLWTSASNRVRWTSFQLTRL